MIEIASNGNGHPKKRKLPTKKQAALVKALSDPNVKTIAEAGKMAGYNTRQQAHESLQSLTVQESLKGLINELRSCGIDQKLYAKKAKEGLDAGTPEKPNFKERREMLALCFRLEGFLNQKDEKSDREAPAQILIVNYADSNPGRGIQASSSGPNGSQGLVKISDDYLAPKGKKNNSNGQ